MTTSETAPFVDTRVVTVSTFAAVEAFLRSELGAPRARPMSAFLEADTLSRLHGRTHLERRRLENVLFRPRVLAGYERHLADVSVDRMLDDLRSAKGSAGVVRCDLVAAMRRQTIELAALIIGIDDVDEDAIADLCRIMEAGIEGIKIEYSTGDRAQIAETAADALARYWDRYIRPSKARRADILAAKGAGALPNDLVSVVIGSGAEWDDDLLLRECLTYLMGVGGTTTVLTSHIVTDLCGWLAARPGGGPISDELLDRAIEESTRLHPPAPAILRVSTGPFAAPGVTVEEGDTVYLDLVRANRDPAVFGADADAYDPNRVVPEGVPRHGLSFGAGRHVCIGRPMFAGSHSTGTVGVGRLILRPLLDAGIALDPDDQPEYAPSLEARHTRLPVVFTAL